MLCLLCNIELTAADMVAIHITGKKHQRNQRLLKENNVDVSALIQISGDFVSENLSLQMLATTYIGCENLAKAKNVWRNSKYITIEYLTSEDARWACRKLGQKYKTEFLRSKDPLHLLPAPGGERGFHETFLLYANTVNPELVERVVQSFCTPSSIGELDKAIGDCMACVQLLPLDYETRERLRYLIETYLKFYYPGVEASIFGSSLNGIGFWNCDLDLYADVGLTDPWNVERQGQKRSRLTALCWKLFSVFKKCAAVTEVKCIPTARVPIVRFRDRKSNIMVDLSFLHGLSVQNSILINIYALYLKPVRPYLMFLRLWGKVHDIVGGGRPEILFTSYTFTMMMLFALMIKPLEIIPPAKCFINNSMVINGWPCGLDDRFTSGNMPNGEYFIINLIDNFFSYYGNTDFKNIVVCPFVGKTLQRFALHNKKLSVLGYEYSDYVYQDKIYVTDGAFSVQDPFDHSFNLSRMLKEQKFQEFQAKCSSAADLCKSIIASELPLSVLFDLPNKAAVSANSSPPVITLSDQEAVPDLRDRINILKNHSGKRLNEQEPSTKQKRICKTPIQNCSTSPSVPDELVIIDDDSAVTAEDVLVVDAASSDTPPEVICLRDETKVSSSEELLSVLTVNGGVDAKDSVFIYDPIAASYRFQFSIRIPHLKKFRIKNKKEVEILEYDSKETDTLMVHQVYSVVSFVLEECLCMEIMPKEYPLTEDKCSISGILSDENSIMQLDPVMDEQVESSPNKVIPAPEDGSPLTKDIECSTVIPASEENMHCEEVSKLSSQGGEESSFKDVENTVSVKCFEIVRTYMCSRLSSMWRLRKKLALQEVYGGGCPLKYELSVNQLVMQQDEIPVVTDCQIICLVMQNDSISEEFLVQMCIDKNDQHVKGDILLFCKYFASLVTSVFQKLLAYVND